MYLAVNPQVPGKAPAKEGSSFNQLLGIKGAAQETVSLRVPNVYLLDDGWRESCSQSAVSIRRLLIANCVMMPRSSWMFRSCLL